MKSLIFMMMLTMAAVSAGVVYLSVNYDPLGGAPHVDVTLDAPPQEEAKAEPAPNPEETTAAVPAVPAAPTEAAAAGAPATAGDPLIASPTGALATGTGGEVSIELPADDTGEPLTTTAFPIPEADAADPALTPGEPAAVDQ